MRAALLVQARKVGPIGRRVREVIARFLLDLRPAPDRADGCGNGGEQGCVTVGVAGLVSVLGHVAVAVDGAAVARLNVARSGEREAEAPLDEKSEGPRRDAEGATGRDSVKEGARVLLGGSDEADRLSTVGLQDIVHEVEPAAVVDHDGMTTLSVF